MTKDLGPKIPSSEITPRDVYLSRRRFMGGTLAVGALAASSAWGATPAQALTFSQTAFPKPADAVTDRALATTYNTFYEFGTSKADPARNAGKFNTKPWTIEIGGEVAKPKTIGVEELLKFDLEERVYRLRCVEAWSMVIPWIGFPLSKLLAQVEPTSKARYVKFTTASKPEEMPGLSYRVLEWPYTEGLRLDEAMHPLTLLTLGMYGDVLPNQNGAPVRIVVPWKYGFKSAKSIVRIDLVADEPKTAWNSAASNEYGFYSNVNPAVDHPRWSQKRERRLPGFFANHDTEPFNGYGEQVASLYAGMDLTKFY